MDTPARPPSTTSALDNIRTVIFRERLRGYNQEDVDEYLERVAVETEALQEQMRQATDRLKQAANKIVDLEGQLERTRAAGSGSGAAAGPPDEALHKTISLAQKVVDQIQSEAQAEARKLVAEAEARARSIVADADEHVRVMTEEAERHLRDEVTRLGTSRTQLAAEVEAISKHLEAERDRMRGALTDMLEWLEEHLEPRPPGEARTAGREEPEHRPSAAPSERAEVPAERPAPAEGPGEPSGKFSFVRDEPSPSGATPVGTQAFSRGVATAPTDPPRDVFAPGLSMSEPNGARSTF